MTDDVIERTITVRGAAARLLDRPGTGDAVILLHGGTPGLTPYVGCADLWRPLMTASPPDRRVIALDLPGAGGTVAQGVGDLTVAGQGRFVVEVADRLALGNVHLVAHAEADLVSLLVARQPGLSVGSVTLMCPTTAIPTGDMSQDLTFLNPPSPLWSPRSQLWALDRLSRCRAHIDDALVTVLARHAEAPAHRAATAWLGEFDAVADLRAERTAAAAAFYSHARDQPFELPIGLVCGAHDPLVDLDRAVVLMEILASGNELVDLHLIGESGHFPFREQTREVAQIVASAITRAGRAAVEVQRSA